MLLRKVKILEVNNQNFMCDMILKFIIPQVRTRIEL